MSEALHLRRANADDCELPNTQVSAWLLQRNDQAGLAVDHRMRGSRSRTCCPRAHWNGERLRTNRRCNRRRSGSNCRSAHHPGVASLARCTKQRKAVTMARPQGLERVPLRHVRTAASGAGPSNTRMDPAPKGLLGGATRARPLPTAATDRRLDLSASFAENATPTMVHLQRRLRIRVEQGLAARTSAQSAFLSR